MSSIKSILICTLLWACSAVALVARGQTSYNDPSSQIYSLNKREDKVPLRILPLGASLTWGLYSESQNGYRKFIRDALRFDGWEVDMVGSINHGTMTDNDVEATSGFTIDQVKEAAKKSLKYRPNVILINAGTNDSREGKNISTTGERMESLINSLLNADGMKQTTIILSTLIPSTNSDIELNRADINNQIRQLAAKMKKDGVSIVLADMDPESPDPGHNWLGDKEDFWHADMDRYDDTHPNDNGYAKMASVWHEAVKEADKLGLIKAATDMDDSTKTCTKETGDGDYAGGLTQRGSGQDDGIYHHSSVSKGTVLSVVSEYDRNQWFFGRLFRRDRDDLLGWFEKDDGTVAYGTWRNTGRDSDRFVKISDTSVDDNCAQAGVNFIDINGDGLDDFVCIAKDGTAYASVNQGDGTDSKPPTFKSIGKIKSSEDHPQDRVRLADIDGDGRADYCVLA